MKNHNCTYALIAAMVLSFFSPALHAQQTQSISKTLSGEDLKQVDLKQGPTRILFVLDASNSMRKLWASKEKWSSAVSVLQHVADSLSKLPNVEIGLRVYGHQTMLMYNDCQDSRLEVSIGPNRAPVIESRLAKIIPQGITPIAYSLEKCVNDFPQTPGKNVVVLITDGEESCEADPCRAARILQEAGITLKPMLIGMDIRPEAIADFDCIGKLYNATNEAEMTEKFDVLLNRVLASTSLEVDLLDENGEPTETNVNMTFFDQHNEIMRYNFYHTLNARGNPDSLFIDPVPTYRIVVNTLPPVVIENVELTPDRHNVVEVKAAQGNIKIITRSVNVKSGPGANIQCLVKMHDGYETLNTQNGESNVKYLTGNYDMDILTLPRIHLENVSVKQSETTTITIPEPTALTVNKTGAVMGGIFTGANSEQEKIYDFSTGTKPDVVLLQPGTYTLIYRYARSTQMESTVEKTIELKEGIAQAVSL